MIYSTRRVQSRVVPAPTCSEKLHIKSSVKSPTNDRHSMHTESACHRRTPLAPQIQLQETPNYEGGVNDKSKRSLQHVTVI